jgi:hypothetical protein
MLGYALVVLKMWVTYQFLTSLFIVSVIAMVAFLQLQNLDYNTNIKINKTNMSDLSTCCHKIY